MKDYQVTSSIYFTKCGDNIIFVGFQLYPYSTFYSMDVRYANSETKGFVSSIEDINYRKGECVKLNLMNDKSTCTNDAFESITPSCKNEISSECSALSKNLVNLNADFTGVKECDPQSINLSNKDEYSALKSKCFDWINNNLIDSTMVLNVKAIVNILDLVNLGSRPKNLRYLQTNDNNKINDEEFIISDKDSDISTESSYASNGALDIDGSSAIYYGIAYASSAGAGAASELSTSKTVSVPTPALSNSGIYATPTLSANTQATINAIAHIKAGNAVLPPTLGGAELVVSKMFVALLMLLLL
jgi:hypothetical protein